MVNSHLIMRHAGPLTLLAIMAVAAINPFRIFMRSVC
jgi:hypothetical protein